MAVPDNGPITVVGAGGIGGCIAARLALAGESVTVVDRSDEHVDAIKSSGLRCDGIFGDQIAEPDRTLLMDEVTGPIEIAILSVKSRDTISAVDAISPLLSPDGFVVSMQNGWNARDIAEHIGHERTLAAMVHMVGNYIGPGHVTRFSRGDLYLGEVTGGESDRVRNLAKRLCVAAPTHGTSNIWGYIWSKQIYGATMPVNALVDVPARESVTLDWVQMILLAVILEGISVSEAEGVQLEPYERFDPDVMRVRKVSDLPAAVAMLPRGSAKGNSGVWHDLKRGRKTEVPYLSGELVRIGRSHGLPMVTNTMIVQMIDEIENGRRAMGWNNLRELEPIAKDVVAGYLA